MTTHFDVSPYRITRSGMEFYCDESVDLHPGDLLCFGAAPEKSEEKPETKPLIYGLVSDIRAQARMLENEALQAVSVDVLHGTPGLGVETAEKIPPNRIGEALLALQGEVQHPLCLGNGFTGDVLNLGTLSVVEGPSFAQKYEALLMLMNGIQPYQRLMVIDPIGVFAPGDGVTVLSAAHDIRLSLVDVGMKRFLAGMTEALPGFLQAQAAQLSMAAEAIFVKIASRL